MKKFLGRFAWIICWLWLNYDWRADSNADEETASPAFNAYNDVKQCCLPSLTHALNVT